MLQDAPDRRTIKALLCACGQNDSMNREGRQEPRSLSGETEAESSEHHSVSLSHPIADPPSPCIYREVKTEQAEGARKEADDLLPRGGPIVPGKTLLMAYIRRTVS